jgi:hypothetical protein
MAIAQDAARSAEDLTQSACHAPSPGARFELAPPYLARGTLGMHDALGLPAPKQVVS